MQVAEEADLGSAGPVIAATTQPTQPLAADVKHDSDDQDAAAAPSRNDDEAQAAPDSAPLAVTCPALEPDSIGDSDAPSEAPSSPLSSPSPRDQLDIDAPQPAHVVKDEDAPDALDMAVDGALVPATDDAEEVKPDVEGEPADALQEAAIATSLHVTCHDLSTSRATDALLSKHASAPALRLLFRFIAERVRIFYRRSAGLPASQWTKDAILASKRFSNPYRFLDDWSQWLLVDVVRDGPQQREEVCFRFVLARLFGKRSTYEGIKARLGRTPTWNDFDLDRYDAILGELHAEGPIYTAAYQHVPPAWAFGSHLSSHQITLRQLQLLMSVDLAGKLSSCSHMREAYSLVSSIPGLGPFMASLILYDLTYAPFLDSLSPNEYAGCGPGSRAFLRLIFGKSLTGAGAKILGPEPEQVMLRWIVRTQHLHWAKAGVRDPPRVREFDDAAPVPEGAVESERVMANTPSLKKGFFKPFSEEERPISVQDLEQSLCEAWRYRWHLQRIRSHPLGPPRSDAASAAPWPRSWVLPHVEQLRLASRPIRPPYPCPGPEDDGSYAVERIVEERGPFVLVRWLGWGPDADTWEPTKDLLDSAGEALQELRAFREDVQSRIVKKGKKGDIVKKGKKGVASPSSSPKKSLVKRQRQSQGAAAVVEKTRESPRKKARESRGA